MRLPSWLGFLACTACGTDSIPQAKSLLFPIAPPMREAPAADDMRPLFTAFDTVTHHPDLVRPGNTLVGLHYDPQGEKKGAIYEMDPQGEVVWSYALTDEQNGERGMLMDVEPTAAGSVLFTVNGTGVFEIDRQGNQLWSYQDPYVSHDADKLDNGNVLFVRGLAPYGEALVMEVDAEGREVWSWDGTQQFTMPSIVNHVDELGAWAHPNGVQRLSDGSSLLTIRNFNCLLEVDAQGTVLRKLFFDAERIPGQSISTNGKYRGSRPHDAELTADGGSYLVGLRNPARIIRLDRDGQRLRWGWRFDEGPFGPRQVHNLKHGSILLATGERIYEVNRQHQVVWELFPPSPQTMDALDSGRLFYSALRLEEGGRLGT